ncbi:cell division protein FtsZ [Sphingobium sp. AN558]|uniref:cell division protein FtsZ n=1 Tax=Sphingobium sp. AN558 TaxID=3133442 RepID=UPI0030BF1274
MSIEISPPHVDELKPRIAVIGVGGAGGNAIANMIAAHVEGVDFIVANTDAQALNASPAERRIQLGPQITEGLGAGSRPEIGKAAAEETIASVEQALEGAHMCFIAAGMGGGTGTGAAPVIAKAARDRGILTVGVVTKPFTFEGNRRMKSAETGIEELQKHVDTLIVIPNQNLFLIANPNTTFKEAFQMADEVLQQGVRGITDLMVMPGLINLDFADVRSVMGEMGKAMMGTGEAEGDGRALQAAEKAIANPLLDGVSMRGAKGVIVSIVGGDDMRLMEVDEAANHIRELVDPDANIIWGSAFNDGLNGKIRVSVVATGIDSDAGGNAAPLTQPFSFANRPAVAVPSAATPRPAPAPAAEPAPVAQAEALELDVPAAPAPAPVEAAAPVPAPTPAPFAAPAPAAVFSDEDPSQDELVLGSDSAEEQPVPAAPAPRVATGGTLFERMAGLTRGTEKGGAPDDGAPGLDIPRFLNRQNNQ